MIMKVAGKPQKVSLEMCLIGLRKRQQKLEQKIEMYETHIKMEHYLLLFLVDGKISMKE